MKLLLKLQCKCWSTAQYFNVLTLFSASSCLPSFSRSSMLTTPASTSLPLFSSSMENTKLCLAEFSLLLDSISPTLPRAEFSLLFKPLRGVSSLSSSSREEFLTGDSIPLLATECVGVFLGECVANTTPFTDFIPLGVRVKYTLNNKSEGQTTQYLNLLPFHALCGNQSHSFSSRPLLAHKSNIRWF